MSHELGSLIVISGPSGAGKGSLIGALLAARPDLSLAVSATTRPPRAGERDGVDYHFLTPRAFAATEAQGMFIETVAYAGNRYGTLASELVAPAGRGVVVEIETRGAAALRARLPHARLVFIAPPSLATLEARLRGRASEDEPAIARRLGAAEAELRCAGDYDAVVVNDDRTRAVAELCQVIRRLEVAPLQAAV